MAVSEQSAPVAAPQLRRNLALGLSLSGGGYRAMLFHAGALWRLNELGWLQKLDAISSVSGGSIAAGLLAASWHELTFDSNGVATNFDGAYLAKLLAFARRTIDFWSIGYGVAGPWTTAADQTIKSYRSLFGRDANLNSLPDRPRFIFCASNLTTGSLFRFEKRYMADYRLGQHFNPDLELAVAVAASAAFPPFLSPLRLDLRKFDFRMRPTDGVTSRPVDPVLLRRAVLTDGGVYDNHGVQPLLHRSRTFLVSDGGAPWGTSTRGFYLWGAQLKRVFATTDNQVRALRRLDLIDRFIGSADPALSLLPPTSSVRQHYGLHGTYWSIATNPESYPTWPHPLARLEWRTLADIGTWLHFLGAQQTTDLVNWGYVVSDLALRSYVDPTLTPGNSLPVAQGRVQPGPIARAVKWTRSSLLKIPILGRLM